MVAGPAEKDDTGVILQPGEDGRTIGEGRKVPIVTIRVQPLAGLPGIPADIIQRKNQNRDDTSDLKDFRGPDMPAGLT